MKGTSSIGGPEKALIPYIGAEVLEIHCVDGSIGMVAIELLLDPVGLAHGDQAG